MVPSRRSIRVVAPIIEIMIASHMELDYHASSLARLIEAAQRAKANLLERLRTTGTCVPIADPAVAELVVQIDLVQSPVVTVAALVAQASLFQLARADHLELGEAGIDLVYHGELLARQLCARLPVERFSSLSDELLNQRSHLALAVSSVGVDFYAVHGRDADLLGRLESGT